MFLFVFFLKQYTPEHIYLNNQEDLDQLTDETSDAFQYLKYQAEKGDVESQVCVTYFFVKLNHKSKDCVSMFV